MTRRSAGFDSAARRYLAIRTPEHPDIVNFDPRLSVLEPDVVLSPAPVSVRRGRRPELWLSAPSATLPNSRYRTPLVPLAPTTSSCARLAATAPRRSRSGSPWTSMVRGCHPMRLSLAAARLRSFVAARARIVFWRLTSRAMVAAPGTRPREGAVSNSTALTSVTRPSRRRDQPADKCQGALCGLRSVDTDDDRAYALRPPDDEHRALGATDDASGDAAHEQATNGAMPAPADHDHIGLKTFGFAENSLNRGSCPGFQFRRPASGARASAVHSRPPSRRRDRARVNRIDRLYSARFFAH